tara:strand:+ start:372 stop:3320 length:2949 start_codon:yes stop_codon:yes gene_type:complete
MTDVAGPLAKRMSFVRTWEDQVVIPTYPLHPDDINPRFFEVEGTLIYPYTMQDHLSRKKLDQSYRAVFLENKFLKIMCLPELGGRLHSVYDKQNRQEMFYRNTVIKPGLIALRGAWISGGVEWNRGPQSHTVTSFSPVDVVSTEHEDGSASIVIGYTEMNFRTGWEVRLTLYPDKAFLDEKIVLFNPTDHTQTYYFWNNTAFPVTPGTKFCYPMRAASDHDRFFSWPIDQGRDRRWLKNYEDATPVFAYACNFDFFGVYDVDRDYGLVACADHRKVPGKKAWTWGQTDAGRTSQCALTDTAGPYIEIQSGPLRTQTDYATFAPSEQVAWQEWWYPVRGLGAGFEYATREAVIGRLDHATQDTVEFRVIVTSPQEKARIELKSAEKVLISKIVDLSPLLAVSLRVHGKADTLIEVKITDQDDVLLAAYTSPLDVPSVDVPAELNSQPLDPVTADDMYNRGQHFDRQMDRVQARLWLSRSINQDPLHAKALIALANLDAKAGLFESAADQLMRALSLDKDNGRAWHLLGSVRLHQDRVDDALMCGTEAADRPDTLTLGLEIIGRAKMRQGAFGEALAAFVTVRGAGELDRVRLFDWTLMAAHCAGESKRASVLAGDAIERGTTRLVPYAVHSLVNGVGWAKFVREVRKFIGEPEFAFLELSLFFADLGRYREAFDLLRASCVNGHLTEEVRPLPFYYLAYFAEKNGQIKQAAAYLQQAAACQSDYVFPSQVEAMSILEYATQQVPDDSRAHLYLGNLLASLSRGNDAKKQWELAVSQDPTLSVAFRNLGMDAWKQQGNLEDAARWFEQAVVARPSDQVARRDLANVLNSLGRPNEAIQCLEAISPNSSRRGDVNTLLARTYLHESRYDESLDVLNNSTYSNWEGDTNNWAVFVSAHIERGVSNLQHGDAVLALQDFESALTYPDNLHVGRGSKPREARAHYWKGKALAALGRTDAAKAAWQAGADGHPGIPEQDEFIEKCRQNL